MAGHGGSGPPALAWRLLDCDRVARGGAARYTAPQPLLGKNPLAELPAGDLCGCTAGTVGP